MFDLGPHLRFCLLDLAPSLVQPSAFTQLLMEAAPSGDLLDDFTDTPPPGVARIGTCHALLAVQKLVDLGEVGEVSRRHRD